MATAIVHHCGIYNIYSTICDDAIFDKGVTLEFLTDHMKASYGTYCWVEWERKLLRAQEHGTSFLNEDLESLVSCNCSGEDGRTLSYQEFIDKYLTVKYRGEQEWVKITV